MAVPDAPTVDEVNDWLCALARLVRETEAKLPHRHLVAGQEAFAYSHTLPDKGAVQQLSEKSFRDFPVDVVNMHPLPNMTYRGKVYDLGQFMSAELHLRELRRYCLDAYRERKPLNLDEDNAATRFRDENGWTIHRKRAWTTLFCGAHYDMIDFSILPLPGDGDAGLAEISPHVDAAPLRVHEVRRPDSSKAPGVFPDRAAGEHGRLGPRCGGRGVSHLSGRWPGALRSGSRRPCRREKSVSVCRKADTASPAFPPQPANPRLPANCAEESM